MCNITSYFSLPLIEETVVYVLDEIDDISKTEEILKKFGIQNFKCYLDGMENWIKFGGTVEFPRFIRFKVSKYRESPVSTVSISAVPGLVRFQISTK